MEKMGVFDRENAVICSKIKEMLKEEFAKQYKNGLYGYIQTKLCYDSNHLEGSALTQDQTSLLFDTQTLQFDGTLIRSKDIEEAQGHFLAFNHLIKTIDEPLSESIIKAFHYCLKSGVFEDRANNYAIGEYKTRPNVIGTTTTCLPKEVPEAMKSLLVQYNSKLKIALEDIIDFHGEFERIHPFQDGNGRVGRLIMFRECLYHNVVPFIIKQEDRVAYVKGIIATQEGDLNPLLMLFQSYQGDFEKMYRYFTDN